MPALLYVTEVLLPNWPFVGSHQPASGDTIAGGAGGAASWIVAKRAELLHDEPMGNPSARPRQRRPSIKTVASLAGVSWSTVSNVINNHPSVRPETRAKVEAAIETLGYRPNPVGRSLRRGTTGTVLLVVTPMTTPLHAELAEEVIGQCRRHGLTAVIETADADPDQVQHVVDHAHPADRDGTITVGAQPASLPAPVTAVAPLVVVSGCASTNGIFAITTDPLAELGDLVDHLSDCGAGSIALATERSHTSPFLTTFVQVLQERGTRPGTGAVLLAHEDGYTGGADLATRLPEPRADAIICTGEDMALGLMAGLERRGAAQPPPVVAALRGSETNRLRHPELVSTGPQVPDLARTAVDTLVGACAPAPTRFTAHLLHRGAMSDDD